MLRNGGNHQKCFLRQKLWGILRDWIEQDVKELVNRVCLETHILLNYKVMHCFLLNIASA